MDGILRLSAKERKSCLKTYRAANPARRALILLLLDQGRTYREITAATLASPTMIRAVKKDWDAGGVSCVLGTQERPFVVAYWLIVVVRWLLHKTPQDFGFFRTRWSCALLALLLWEQERIRISAETVRRGMRQMEFVWRRPRPVVGAMRVAKAITISSDERKTLGKWARGRSTPARLILRAKIVLAAADGKLNKDIASELNTGMKTVCLWRNRFAKSGLAGIACDAPRGGRPSESADTAAEIVRVTTTEKPHAATHWSTRTLAKHLKVSRSMVHRVWQANRLQPHRIKTFKVSNDPQFAEKVVDIVGLYLNPPEHALVLCVDEKSQIQALDRTQKGLPIHRGRLGTMTHDYKRNGTTTLFAALIVSEGLVIEACMKRHRHQEWIKFLEKIDASTDPSLDLHLVADNYATHKHPKVKRWLAKHPRFRMHFTPTSSSWLNLVERWFREITQKRLRRGTFRSVRELIEAIVEYVEAHNEQAQGMCWTALPDDILAKVRRARAVLDKTPTA